MNESPVTPYKRLSVKYVLSLEKPFVGNELKHLCEVRGAGYGRGPEEPTGHICWLAPHLLFWDAASSPSVKPKAALTGFRRSCLRGSSMVQLGHRPQAHRMLPVRTPEGVPKALLPPNITDALALIPVTGFRIPRLKPLCFFGGQAYTGKMQKWNLGDVRIVH